MTRTAQCILYRNFSEDDILMDMCALMDRAKERSGFWNTGKPFTGV